MDLALLGTAAALIAVAFQFADAGAGWHDLRRAHSGGLRQPGRLDGPARRSRRGSIARRRLGRVLSSSAASVRRFPSWGRARSARGDRSSSCLAVTRGVLRRRPNLNEERGITCSRWDAEASWAQVDARYPARAALAADRRARLAQVADDFGVVPPTGFAAIRAIRWKTANAYVWVGTRFALSRRSSPRSCSSTSSSRLSRGRGCLAVVRGARHRGSPQLPARAPAGTRRARREGGVARRLLQAAPRCGDTASRSSRSRRARASQGLATGSPGRCRSCATSRTDPRSAVSGAMCAVERTTPVESRA